jgi:hypothetical protein
MKINFPSELTLTPEMIKLGGEIILALLVIIGAIVGFKVLKQTSIKNIVGKNKLKVRQSGQGQSKSKAEIKNVIGSNEIEIEQDNQ